MRPLKDFDKSVLLAILEYQHLRPGRWWGPAIFFHMYPEENRFRTVESGVSAAIQRLKNRGLIQSGPSRLDGFMLSESGEKIARKELKHEITQPKISVCRYMKEVSIACLNGFDCIRKFINYHPSREAEGLAIAKIFFALRGFESPEIVYPEITYMSMR